MLPPATMTLRVDEFLSQSARQSVAAAFPHTFPPMLLYAMGRIPKEQVPPVVLFDNQQQSLSGPGVAAQGTFKTRTVYDVIGVNGERRGPACRNPTTSIRTA